MFEAIIKRLPEPLKCLNIAVIMGGPSPECNVSIMSGRRVMSALNNLGLKPLALEFDNHLVKKLLENKIDLVFLATHGAPGEDGSLQGLLDTLEIPYTGAGVAGSACALNKVASKTILAHEGMTTPKFHLIDKNASREDSVRELTAELGFPMVIKPVDGGSSLGVRLVKTIVELRTSLELLLPEYPQLFAEQYIDGRELTASVIEDSNGKATTLPILELEPRHLFYDYECKVEEGKTDFIIPAQLDIDIRSKIDHWSKRIHELLNLRDFSRSDFILDETGTLYYLETNSIPGLTHLSDLPAQAKAAGMVFEELVSSIIMRAYSRMTRER